jgi:hypothetical protein
MWNYSSSCFQVRIESGPNDVYHPKAGPVSDCEKNLTRNRSDTEIIPNCARYRLTCSIELDPSAPLNLVTQEADTWAAVGLDRNRLNTAWYS